MREMGNLCRPGEKPPAPEPKKVPEPKPTFDYIVRGNFIPQQNGDLKVREEQGSADFDDQSVISGFCCTISHRK